MVDIGETFDSQSDMVPRQSRTSRLKRDIYRYMCCWPADFTSRFILAYQPISVDSPDHIIYLVVFAKLLGDIRGLRAALLMQGSSDIYHGIFFPFFASFGFPWATTATSPLTTPAQLISSVMGPTMAVYKEITSTLEISSAASPPSLYSRSSASFENSTLLQ